MNRSSSMPEEASKGGGDCRSPTTTALGTQSRSASRESDLCSRTPAPKANESHGPGPIPGPSLKTRTQAQLTMFLPRWTMDDGDEDPAKTNTKDEGQIRGLMQCNQAWPTLSSRSHIGSCPPGKILVKEKI